MSITLISDNKKEVEDKIYKVDVEYIDGTRMIYEGRDIRFPDVNPTLFFIFKHTDDDVPRNIISLDKVKTITIT